MPESKLRVCHVITQLELGGAQRNTLYTVEHLDRERYDVSLVCGRGGILDEEAAAGEWPTTFLRSLVRQIHPIKDPIAVIALYRHFRRTRPHIVHTHSSKAGILGRLAAYAAGVPVIVHTFHGFGFTPGQSERMRALFVKLERWCAYLSTHLIFVSADNLEEAARLNIHGRASHSLIRSGIVMTPSAPVDIRAELNLPRDAWIVTSVGNFKPQKNPLELVSAACNLTKADPSIRVLLAGDGELRDESARYVNGQGQSANVHFLGWRQDARSIVAASDAFLLMSLWEGLPRALVEAFAEGRPAVAYAVNGVRDILVDGENGFAIEPGQVPAAVEKLLWLRAHPQDAGRMGERGRARVEKEFDIDEMVRLQEALYASLYERVPLKGHYEPRWVPASR